MKNFRIVLSILMAISALVETASIANAAPLSFQNVPSGAGAREPAPNVIVSVDDSGSMQASGMATLREALTTTFGIGSNLTDNRIRLAWQSMNRCPQLGASTPNCGGYNGMDYLSGSHRVNFDNWARSLQEGGGTPGHLMMDNAGQYLAAPIANANSAWAADPRDTLNPVLSCRKNFHIFMTDGGWNSGTNNTGQHIDSSATNNGTRIVRGGNADGTTTILTSTATYDVTSNETRLYRDAWGGATLTANNNATTLSTLSDLAFFYWSRDLQPGLTNDVRSTYTRTSSETFVATNGSSTTLSPFWNPRNNPATWQHMVNYTIGFNTASTWTGSPTWGGDTFSGNLPDLINGVASWQSPFCEGNNQVAGANTGNRPCDGGTGYGTSGASPVVDGRRMDLWHAALNSRGIFVPAPNAQALVNAFQTILDNILQQTASQLVSITSNSSRVTTDDYVYLAGFSSERWSGELQAFSISNTTLLPSRSPTWKASAILDVAEVEPNAPSTRLILTYDGSAGRSFRWTNLTTAQRNALTLNGVDSDVVGEARLNYLRGVRTLEERNGGYLRNRNSRLGDMVNSNLWFVGKPEILSVEYPGHHTFRNAQSSRRPMIYVGGNDGMLHGFDARTGIERIAYVPLGVYSKLRSYSTPSYVHTYMVDGSPFTGDANLGGGLGWRTVLVSGLGAGSKGYFILDVTNPNNFSDPNSGTSGLVLMDSSATVDPDIGHIFASPVVDNETSSISDQIVKLNNGRWAAIMGNGYNSTNERPVLLIQYLDNGTLQQPRKIIADSTIGQTNGLGAPRPVDVNGDGVMDYVYAGDLRGNVWKFNLTGSNDANWGVSSWQNGNSNCSNLTSCTPFFVATDAGGNRQPIVSAPLVVPHTLGGLQVVFGTGRELTTADRSNTQQQTIYAVWDVSTYSSAIGGGSQSLTDVQNITTGRSALVAQTVIGTNTATGIVSTSSNPVIYNKNLPVAPRGWYFDLPMSGERVTSHPALFEGLKAQINSFVPGSSEVGESCNLVASQDSNYTTILNLITGAPASVPIFGNADPGGEGSRLATGPGKTTTKDDTRHGMTRQTSTDHFRDDGSAAPSSCTGTDCSCNGKVCVCTGPSCTCTDPLTCKASPSSCGDILPGLVDMCRAGLFGTRTDWRELR